MQNEQKEPDPDVNSYDPEIDDPGHEIDPEERDIDGVEPLPIPTPEGEKEIHPIKDPPPDTNRDG